MNKPSFFTMRKSLAIFLVARAQALTNQNYRVAVQQIEGLSEDEHRWLLKHWEDQGWIVPMTSIGVLDYFHGWVLTSDCRAYAPGERRGMFDEEHEYYIGVAVMVAKKSGKIQMSDFAKHAPREGLWRLLETCDVVRSSIMDNRGNLFTLDQTYRDK